MRARILPERGEHYCHRVALHACIVARPQMWKANLHGPLVASENWANCQFAEYERRHAEAKVTAVLHAITPLARSRGCARRWSSCVGNSTRPAETHTVHALTPVRAGRAAKGPRRGDLGHLAGNAGLTSLNPHEDGMP